MTLSNKDQHSPAEPRIDFMGCPIDNLDMQGTLERIGAAIESRTRLQHVVVNVAKLMDMRRNPDLRRDVIESDLINIDGMGVVYGCRLLGFDVKERVSGIDLMLELLARCERKGWRPYFLGARQEVLDQALAEIRRAHPTLDIAGSRNGYFSASEEAEVAKDIRDARPDCLFIAISSPIKENFLNRHRDSLDVPFLMGIGGTLDVIAGKVSRAPKVMQDWGLEWSWRLAQEPRRMWRRYVFTNAQYASVLAYEMLSMLVRPGATARKRYLK